MSIKLSRKILEQNGFKPTKNKNIYILEVYDDIGNITYEEFDLTNEKQVNLILSWIEQDGEDGESQIEQIDHVKERTDELMLTHPKVMRSTTGYEIKTVAQVTTMANFKRRKSDDMECYAYKKDILDKLKELKEQGVKGVPTYKTFDKHMKTLSKIMLDDITPYIAIEDTPNGIVYRIKQSYNGKWFQTIPCEQLKELIACTNNNVIKLYLIFKYTLEDKKDFYPIDRGYLCRHMGMTESKKSKDNITTIVNVLAKLGYIKRRYEVVNNINGSNGKKICKYRLTTFEEWRQVTKNAGIVK